MVNGLKEHDLYHEHRIKVGSPTCLSIVPVEKREARIKAAEKKGLRREERRSAKTRRSKDGTWTKKNNAYPLSL